MKTLSELNKMRKKDLINWIYNEQIHELCDLPYDDNNSDRDIHNSGKLIPYIGWFWRSITVTDPAFATIGRIDHTVGDEPVGDVQDSSDEFVGIMQNNKWGYPERSMTKAEIEKFCEYIDLAIKTPEIKDRDQVLSDLWDWMQTLEIQ